VQFLYLLDVRRAYLVEVADAQCRSDEAGGGAGDAIGDEAQVVGRMLARQPFIDFFADVLALDVAG